MCRAAVSQPANQLDKLTQKKNRYNINKEKSDTKDMHKRQTETHRHKACIHDRQKQKI